MIHVCFGGKDGVIGRRCCGSLKILGAALQADGETRSVDAASRTIDRRDLFIDRRPFSTTVDMANAPDAGYDSGMPRGAIRIQRAFVATLSAALVAPAMAVAGERVEICAQDSATGQTYHVTAISTNGSELNEATDTLNYNFLNHYIVILWAHDRTSIIEMDGAFVGPTYIQRGGTDQKGRSWEISAYSPVACTATEQLNLR